MNCPVDGTELKMSERNGVEIDYCPQCRGVWLDRGELDKIIERSTNFERQPDYDDDRYEAKDGHYNNPQGKRKRKSFLGDMFDIFD